MMRLAAAMLLASASTASAVEWNDSWRWCQFPYQCDVIKDECDNWTAINNRFKENAETYFNHARPFVVCDEPFLLPPPKATCNIKIRTCEVTYG